MLSGNTFSQVIPFLIAPFLARIFSVEEFAEFANILAIIGLIGIVSTGRLEIAIPLPKSKKKAQNIVFTGLLICILLSVLCGFIPLFGQEISDIYNSKEISRYLWLIPISVLSYGLLGLTSNWALREQKFTNLSVGKVVQSIVNNGLAVVLGYYGAGVYGLLASWILSQYINISYLFWSFNKKFNLKEYNLSTVKSTLIEYKDFPLVNSLHAFMDIFATQFVLFWMISSFFGNIELGLFSVMVKYIKAPIVLVSSSVSQLFYVEATKAKNEGLPIKPIAIKTLKTTILFAIPFVIILGFFGPIIFKIYLGSNWEFSGIYARSLIPMFFLYFLVSPISSIPILFNRQKLSFIFNVLGYFLTLVCLYLCTYFNWSFIDSLWIYGITYSVHYLFLLAWFNHFLNKKV